MTFSLYHTDFSLKKCSKATIANYYPNIVIENISFTFFSDKKRSSLCKAFDNSANMKS